MGEARRSSFVERGGQAALFVLLLFQCGPGEPQVREAYTNSGCPRCHGSDLAGTMQGPSLTNINRLWDRTSLSAFLANPDSFRMSSRRLNLVAEQYPAPMPQFVMPDTTREQIVDYLVGTKK